MGTLLKNENYETSAFKEENYNELDGTIEIKQGKFIIKDPCEGGKPAVISEGEKVTLTVNGEKVSPNKAVYLQDNIEVYFSEDEAKRYMNLKTSLDKMEALY